MAQPCVASFLGPCLKCPMPLTTRSLRSLLRHLNSRSRPAPRVPEGARVYVIGDIHGRADLLARLHRQIEQDAVGTPRSLTKRLVYLGDYVDRGLQSKAVIDLLLDGPLPGFEPVYLKGNHEDALLRFLDDVKTGPGWFAIGGDATAMSYGIRLAPDLSAADRFNHVWTELRRTMPQSHVKFMTDLLLSHVAGDYVMVHAGIRPGVALEDQAPDDLMWIRDDFLRSDADHGKVVVHGHSPRLEPEVRENRIGIDTTAFATNVLTCLVLEGTSRRFLSTG